MKEEERRTLERFIEKVLESRDPTEARAIPDEAYFRTLAVKYGLDESLWDQLSVEREAHETRGRLFFREGNWDEAIAELEQAFVIAPYETELTYDLGQAYAKRYEAGNDDADRERAGQLFRRCLEIDPSHAAAVSGISRLDRVPRKSSAKRIALGTSALLCLALGLLVAREMAEDDDSSPEPVGQIEPEESGVEKASRDSSKTTGIARPVEIPVDFPVESLGENFAFSPRSSILTRYDGKFSYEMKAVIRVGSSEVRRLEGELDLLDGNGEVKAVAPFKALAHYQNSAFEGDSLPVSVLVFREEEAINIESAKMRVTLFEQSALAGSLEPDPEIPFSTEGTALPPNGSIIVRQRVLTISTDVLKPSFTTVKLVITVENTGKRPIRSLMFLTSAVGRDGETIPQSRNPMFSSKTTSFLASSPPGSLTVVQSTEPGMEPGERRAALVNLYLPDTAPEDLESVQLSLGRFE